MTEESGTEDEMTTKDIVPRASTGEVVQLRAPNRRPRWKHNNNIWELRKLKELWLRTYKVCGDPELCCNRVGRTVRTFYIWLETDVAFKAEYQRLKGLWEEVVGEVLQNLDIQATVAVREALEQKVDPRLRAEMALRILRAHGHLVERTATEHTGPGGGPVKVVHTVELIEPKERSSHDATQRQGGTAKS